MSLCLLCEVVWLRPNRAGETSLIKAKAQSSGDSSQQTLVFNNVQEPSQQAREESDLLIPIETKHDCLCFMCMWLCKSKKVIY